MSPSSWSWRSAPLRRSGRAAPGRGRPPGPTPAGESEQDTGALAAALTDGIDARDGTFGGYLPALLAGIVVPITIVVSVVTIDLTSALVLIVTLPLIPMFMVLIGLAARVAMRNRFVALTALSSQRLTVLQGLTVVRVTGSAPRVGAAVRAAAERLRATTLEALRGAFISAMALSIVIVPVRALSVGKGVSRYLERRAGHDVALRVVDLRQHAFNRLLPQAPAGLARWRPCWSSTSQPPTWMRSPDGGS